jgi:hypothetical protein
MVIDKNRYREISKYSFNGVDVLVSEVNKYYVARQTYVNYLTK